MRRVPKQNANARKSPSPPLPFRGLPSGRGRSLAALPAGLASFTPHTGAEASLICRRGDAVSHFLGGPSTWMGGLLKGQGARSSTPRGRGFRSHAGGHGSPSTRADLELGALFWVDGDRRSAGRRPSLNRKSTPSSICSLSTIFLHQSRPAPLERRPSARRVCWPHAFPGGWASSYGNVALYVFDNALNGTPVRSTSTSPRAASCTWSGRLSS